MKRSVKVMPVTAEDDDPRAQLVDLHANGVELHLAHPAVAAGTASPRWGCKAG